MTALNTMIAEDCATYRKRITELQADNAKLREALRAIVEHKMLGIDPGTPSWREKIEAARAALSQEKP